MMKRLLLLAALALPFTVNAAEYLGMFKRGETIPVMFATYNTTNGASITITGLAVTDVEVYKGVSMTQRASDSGYALIDTDGIDIDTTTGAHGFSIDTSDDTTAGFWTPGAYYTIMVNSITINTQTVVAMFRFQLDPDVVLYGTAQATDSDATTIQLASWTSVANDKLNGRVICILEGTSVDDCRLITGWVSATDTATVSAAFTADPTSDSVYVVKQGNQAYVVTDTTGNISADIKKVNGDATAAGNLESYTDGTTPIPADIVSLDGTTITCTAGTACGP